LLATGRQITADSTEYFGPLNGSKAAGYLLLNLGHPNIVFAQIIRKRDLFIFHESEDIILKISQPLQQIAGLRFFDPASFAFFLGPDRPRAFNFTFFD
jgi:hypothetical protein